MYAEAVSPVMGVAPLYHWYDGVPPFTGLAVKVTVVPRQILFWLAAIETLAGTGALTTIVTIFEIAGLPEMHARFEVMITQTWSPLTGTNEQAGRLGPVGIPLLYHWYDGVPPLTGVAMNVTRVPVQMLF